MKYLNKVDLVIRFNQFQMIINLSIFIYGD